MSTTSTITEPPPALPSLSKHSQPLSASTTELLDTFANDAILIEEIGKLQAGADQTQRQLNKLTDHVDQSIDTLDELEIATLPILVSRCHDLERIFCNIDQLYALVKEIEHGFDALEQRCSEIEQAQGSSASVRKNVGMFFRSMFDVDLKSPKQKPMPTNPNMVETAVPNFGTYINKGYVPEDQVKKILEEQQKEQQKQQQQQQLNDENNETIEPSTPQTPVQQQIALPVGKVYKPEIASPVPKDTKDIKIVSQQQSSEPNTFPTTPATPTTPTIHFQQPLAGGEEPEEEDDVEYVDEDDAEYIDGEEPED